MGHEEPQRLCGLEDLQSVHNNLTAPLSVFQSLYLLKEPAHDVLLGHEDVLVVRRGDVESVLLGALCELQLLCGAYWDVGVCVFLCFIGC